MSEHYANVCGKHRRYFPQQTCFLARGHAGDHEDETHWWHNDTRVPPPGEVSP